MGGRGSTSGNRAQAEAKERARAERLRHDMETAAFERQVDMEESMTPNELRRYRRAQVDETNRIAREANEQARDDNERTILYLNQRESYNKPDVTATVVALEGLPVGTTIAHTVRRSSLTGGTTGNGYGVSIFRKMRSGEWRSGSTGYGLGNSTWTPEDVADVLRTSTGIRILRDGR